MGLVGNIPFEEETKKSQHWDKTHLIYIIQFSFRIQFHYCDNYKYTSPDNDGKRKSATLLGGLVEFVVGVVA